MRPARAIVSIVLCVAACASAMRASAEDLPSRSRMSGGANEAFRAGLGHVYGFDYNSAITAFERASTLAPNASAPWWGVALALGPSLNDADMEGEGRVERAARAAQRAVDLARAEGEQSRDYAAAIAARYSTDSSLNRQTLNTRYAHAMQVLAHKYPRDIDAAVLAAESLMLANPRWWDPTTRAPLGATGDAVALLESALRRSPQHIGANHFYIHLMEQSPTPERALPSARRLDRQGASAGHLLHMPSHIYMRLGDYHAAVASNRRAMGAEPHHAGAHGPVPVYQNLEEHTREYLAAAAMMTGQSQLAKSASDDLFVRLRFKRWTDSLAQPMPAGPIARVEWYCEQILALIAVQRLDDARTQIAAFDQHVASLPDNAQWWADPMTRFLTMVRHEFAARMAWAMGDRTGAVNEWRATVVAEDQLTRQESVMPWFHSARESLGAALFLTRQYVAAEATFRDDLQRLPRNPRSLFGLSEALAAQGRAKEATKVRQEFERGWHAADVPLTMTDL